MGKKAISEAMIGTKTKPVDWKKLYSGLSVLKESLEDEILVKLISKLQTQRYSTSKRTILFMFFLS